MEIMNEIELKAHLIKTDDSFRTLNQRHSDYDERLQALEAKHHLSVEEQMEEVRLKKLKLATKDQMREIMSRHKAQHVS